MRGVTPPTHRRVMASRRPLQDPSALAAASAASHPGPRSTPSASPSGSACSIDLASSLSSGSSSPSPSCDGLRDASPPGPAMAFSPSPPRAHFCRRTPPILSVTRLARSCTGLDRPTMSSTRGRPFVTASADHVIVAHHGLTMSSTLGRPFETACTDSVVREWTDQLIDHYTSALPPGAGRGLVVRRHPHTGLGIYVDDTASSPHGAPLAAYTGIVMRNPSSDLATLELLPAVVPGSVANLFIDAGPVLRCVDPSPTNTALANHACEDPTTSATWHWRSPCRGSQSYLQLRLPPPS